MDGKYQNQITTLPKLNDLRYENIFKMYKTPDNQYYYSILQAINFPDFIDDTKIFYIQVRQNLPWTAISYNAYQTIELWWLICLVNKIYNPVKGPSAGTVLKIIRPEYIRSIIDEIRLSLR